VYVPAHFSVDDAAARDLLAAAGAAHLVTATKAGLLATRLPYVWAPEVGEHGALQAHLARTNDQWRLPVLGEALAIVHGPDGYVTPSWYATKAEHGRVVPTWNYVTAHVYGRFEVHDDQAWLAEHLHRLTERFEAGRDEPWAIEDAPPRYIAGHMRAVVGVELVITRVEAKAKVSQNRSEADRDGVAAGFAASGHRAMADAVRTPPPRA
jgi:transcriptional regulator